MLDGGEGKRDSSPFRLISVCVVMSTKRLPKDVTLDQLKQKARKLYHGLRIGEKHAIEFVLLHHPQFSGKSEDSVKLANFSKGDTEFLIAREYGFRSWVNLKDALKERETHETNIRRMVPLIRVKHMHESLKFYEKMLGFERVAVWPEQKNFKWCRLRREEVQIMLEQWDEVWVPETAPMTLCLIVKDVDKIYKELRRRKLDVDPPFEAHYGMRQLFLKDPDGHSLWVESPTSPEALEAYTT